MPEKKNNKHQGKKEAGCCGFLSIRVKAYLLLFICSIVAAAALGLSTLIPLASMRDLEEKQAEIDILTMMNDIAMDMLAFKDLADASLRDIVTEINKTNSLDDMEKTLQFINSYFKKNGQWNGDLYRSGYAFYNQSRMLVIGELHSMNPETYKVNSSTMPFSDKMKGVTGQSKDYLKRILLDDGPWQGVADIGTAGPVRGYYPLYIVVTIPLRISRYDGVYAWIVLIMDQRFSVRKTVTKLKYCAGSIVGNTVPSKAPVPKDYEMYAFGLKAIKGDKAYRTLKETDGEYKTLIHNQNGLIHEGMASCHRGSKVIYESKEYFGTTYIAIRDMAYNQPNMSVSYVRFDHELEIMNGTMNFVIVAVVIPSAVFLFILLVVVVIYVEVGVMHKLDQAKKSLNQIVLERRAIMEQYLKGDKASRNYYNFSKGKGKEDDNFNDLLDEIAASSSGGGDELGVLMNMSDGIGEWMDHILQDKLKRLDVARKENVYYRDALTLLSVWSRRSDVRFSPSYIATDASFNRDFDMKSKFDAFSKTMNLTHILGNAMALEVFKGFCKASHNEASLYFILDVAWLNMMEDAIHSKDDGDSSFTDTSGSVSVAHGSVTHSQIARLVQTIFSTYIHSPDHSVPSIGLTPAAIKRLVVRADARGRVKYSKGLFKSAATDVRHYIDSEILPLFKTSAHFRALFILLNTTGHISFPSSNDAVIYSWPFIQPDNSESSKKKEDSNDEEKNDEEEKAKKYDVVTRLPLGIVSSEIIETLVEEEKNCQVKNVDASLASLPSASGQSSSKSSLPSTGSHAGSRSKLRAVSPFASLLPGVKRKASNADGDEEDSEEKKSSDWMKKSFALTSKKSESSFSNDDSHDDE